MADAASPARYSWSGRALHWGIAALIAVQLALGLLVDDLGPGEGPLAALHATLGIATLALVGVRLAWRATASLPPPLAAPGSAQRIAAQAVHGALYLLMLAAPLSGWLAASGEAARIPLLLGASLPALPLGAPGGGAGDDEGEGEGDEAFEEVHELAAWVLLALAALHAAAAWYHQRVLQDGTLDRMR